MSVSGFNFLVFIAFIIISCQNSKNKGLVTVVPILDSIATNDENIEETESTFGYTKLAKAN